MDKFSPLSEMTISETFYLFGDDTLIKILDDEEYLYDKVVEEWVPSQLIKTYKEKEIIPKIITKEQAEDVIAKIILQKKSKVRELDFRFIEELVNEKREFILTNDENKTFKIKKVNIRQENIIKGIIIFCVLITVFGNIFTIIKTLNTDNNKEVIVNTFVENITAKNLVIIKNSQLPTSYTDYIEEQLTKEQALGISIDTSSVNTRIPGMYTYKITFNNKEFVGVVIVVNSEQEKNQTIDQLENPDKYLK